ncbi:hypothetical protein [Paraburkholderia tropica]|uniref:hypothetical protein n=1 Tax=Paraburkholderia tropica TaxID=92647 RepID=UPI003D26EA09
MDKTLIERVCNFAKNLRGLYFNTNCSPDGFRFAVEALANDADKLLAALASDTAGAPSDMPDELPGADQDWATIDPSVAFHLIERHADNWAHAGQLMELWRSAVNARDAAAAQPDERAALPAGWKLVRVNQHFDALIEALEHAESKGYLPDALKEEWASFACDENVDARAAAPQAALTDEQILQTAARFIPAVTEPRVRDYAIVDFARALLATAPTERMSDAAREEEPSWTNPLTPYGMLVRALRIVAGATLMDMANFLGRGPAALSSLEFGRKPVTNTDIVDAASYFASVGIQSTTHALTIAARKAEIERSGSTGGEA